MGKQKKKQVAATTEEKKEDKTEQKKEEKTEQIKDDKTEEKKDDKTEQKKDEAKPPLPFILSVNLHCAGCAMKIEKSLMKIRGVEEVKTDMELNQVTIKGIVNPEAVCKRIMKKTKRVVKVLSPSPPANGEPLPQAITSQVSGLTSVELTVNMHCQACADQLKRKILKMRGVQTVETELGSSKVMVTGTMEASKLVEHVYRRTKKQAQIVPQPEPEPEKPAAKKEKEEEEKKPAPITEDAKPEEKVAEKKEEEEEEEPKKEKGEGSKEEAIKEGESNNNEDEFDMKKMMYYYTYQPVYVMEQIPPPQLFSDENPNACCIS